MLEASVLFSEFIGQKMILNFYLMSFCGKVQPSMTPAGATDLTHCDRESEKQPCLSPLPTCPRFAKIHGSVDLGSSQRAD